jgi:hypothetical protein
MFYIVSDIGPWKELGYQRRPLTLRGAFGLAVLPALILTVLMVDCVRHDFWPRPTADAALFAAMVSALVAIGRAYVLGRRQGQKRW